jgi:hypothetical protein
MIKVTETEGGRHSEYDADNAGVRDGVLTLTKDKKVVAVFRSGGWQRCEVVESEKKPTTHNWTPHIERDSGPFDGLTIGRIVWVYHDQRRRPAIVTDVLGPAGMVKVNVFHHGIESDLAEEWMYSETDKPGTWCWPRRETAKSG